MTHPLTRKELLVSEGAVQVWMALDSSRFMSARELRAALGERGGHLRVRDLEQALEPLSQDGVVETRETAYGYDRHAALYDARPEYGPRVYDRIREHTSDSQRSSVLEVGCGTGVVLRQLHRMCTGTLAGVELSREMAVQARKKLARERIPADVLHGRAEMLPIEDRTVGTLVVASALHWFNERLFWPEADRVTRVDNRIIIFTKLPDPRRANLFTNLYGATARRSWNMTLTRMVFGVPDLIGLRHFEIFTEEMVVPGPREFARIVSSWSREKNKTPAEVERFLSKRSIRWPQHVDCNVAFAVLEAMKGEHTRPERR